MDRPNDEIHWSLSDVRRALEAVLFRRILRCSSVTTLRRYSEGTPGVPSEAGGTYLIAPRFDETFGFKSADVRTAQSAPRGEVAFETCALRNLLQGVGSFEAI